MRQILCPACGAVNRAAESKNALGAKCGHCGERLFDGRPREVSGDELAAHLSSNVGIAVLLDVWAPWCGPCRMMGPQFAAAARKLEPDVRLLKLDSQAHPAAAGELGVSGIPTLILFRDGRVVARQSGAMSAGQIVAWTTQVFVSQAPAPERQL